MMDNKFNKKVLHIESHKKKLRKAEFPVITTNYIECIRPEFCYVQIAYEKSLLTLTT